MRRAGDLQNEMSASRLNFRRLEFARAGFCGLYPREGQHVVVLNGAQLSHSREADPHGARWNVLDRQDCSHAGVVIAGRFVGVDDLLRRLQLDGEGPERRQYLNFARNSRLSYHTVRTLLSRAMVRTETRSQLELVLLISRALAGISTRSYPHDDM